MIRDTKGRKWFLRFKQYREGWHWDARHKGYGVEAGRVVFDTKALAEADARRFLQDHDHIAYSQEYLRRLQMRGSHCRLTAEDREAIGAAGTL